MDADNRRISVYDLTGLRVHPNGHRVHQTEGNLALGKYRRNFQNSRGWIADDAGGSITIPKYREGRRAPSSEAGEAEYIREGETGTRGEESEAETEAEESRHGKGKRRKKQNNMGPIKRKKFLEDDSYISGFSQVVGIEMPSQDLLKNIHYFAAKYYDERGLLLNTAKRYRQTRKLRKHHNVGRSSESTPEGSRSNQSLDAGGMEQVVTGNDNDLNTRRRQVNRDMYRVLDGSFLVAVGVLTREIVMKLVASKERSKCANSPPSDDFVEEEESVEPVQVPQSDSFDESRDTDGESIDDGAEEVDESEWEDESGSEV